jgi:hypothetical protein
MSHPLHPSGFDHPNITEERITSNVHRVIYFRHNCATAVTNEEWNLNFFDRG